MVFQKLSISVQYRRARGTPLPEAHAENLTVDVAEILRTSGDSPIDV